MEIHGLAVTLLHGGPGRPGSMALLDAALTARGARVRRPAYAHFGTGDLPAALERLHADLGGAAAQPAVLIGHSLGGLIAARLVAAGLPALAVVGLGACWRGLGGPGSGGVRQRLLARSVPSLRQIDRVLPAPGLDVPVVSVVSTGDDTVPEWSSRLGTVVTVPGVAHARLPRLTGVVLEVLRRLDQPQSARLSPRAPEPG